jgi:L-asparaginase
MTLRVFVTGGTFDKEYDEINGRLDFGDTHLLEMLRRGRCELDLEVRTLMMVDSLELTEGDRETIADNCARVPEARIVITHGTDTMVQTAAVLARRLSGAEGGGDEGVEGGGGGEDGGTARKTVVLTGAMIPYAFGSSDGLFNLGSALSFAQVLPPGIYVAMNGRCFDWNNVRKNRQTGRFEPLR